MADVSVSLNSVIEAKKHCGNAQKTMQDAVAYLKKELITALEGWKDERSKEFEAIVNQCMTALKQPMAELKKCDVFLAQLGKIIADYESISFSKGALEYSSQPGSNGGSAGASTVQSSAGGDTAIEASVNRASQSKPRNLTATQYGFEPMAINGERCMMYNKPAETVRGLIGRQGQNSRNMRGTCGLCQCVNILRLAGVSDVTEDDVINVAMSCTGSTADGLCIYSPSPGRRGGTSAYARQEIMGRYNLQTDILPIGEDRSQAVSQLAQQVSTGHGVIISVDAGIFWNNANYLGGGHAVSLISVSQAGDRFVYCDTGNGRVGVVSASDLEVALTGRPANVTRNIIR